MDINTPILTASNGIEAFRDWASSYSGTVSSSIREWMQYFAPTLPVSGSVAIYTQYDRRSAFIRQKTLADLSKGFRKVNPKGTNKQAVLEVHGLESDILPTEKLTIGSSSADADYSLQEHYMLVEDAMSYGLLDSFIDTVDTLPTTELNWRDAATATPIDDLRQMREIFWRENGVLPNRIYISMEVLNLMQASDEVQRLIQYNSANALTTDLIKQLLNYSASDDVDIRVGLIPVNNGGENEDIFAGKLFMFYAMDAPRRQDKTAIRTFLHSSGDLLGELTVSFDEKTKVDTVSMMTMRTMVASAPDCFQVIEMTPATP